MNNFREMRGYHQATDDDGVVVSPSYSPRYVYYENHGAVYLIPKEDVGNIRLEDGRLSRELFDKIDISSAFKSDERNVQLPAETLNRIRSDLTKGYAALGLHCVFK